MENRTTARISSEYRECEAEMERVEKESARLQEELSNIQNTHGLESREALEIELKHGNCTERMTYLNDRYDELHGELLDRLQVIRSELNVLVDDAKTTLDNMVSDNKSGDSDSNNNPGVSGNNSGGVGSSTDPSND